MFVGDLSDGDIRIAKSITQLPFPKAVILGNHDRGGDPSGNVLQSQLRLLAGLHCGWKHLYWEELGVSVVGARPCSGGGGFHLSEAVKNVFGPITIEESVDRIVSATKRAQEDIPLIILAHSGPTGLGSDSNSICGRDWKKPAIDWGDKDLALAIDKIREFRNPELVVFGHMHHQLYRGGGIRKTFYKDQFGTFYLNTACVPRRVKDRDGNILSCFSQVDILEGKVIFAAHLWIASNGRIVYQETLLDKKIG